MRYIGTFSKVGSRHEVRTFRCDPCKRIWSEEDGKATQG